MMRLPYLVLALLVLGLLGHACLAEAHVDADAHAAREGTLGADHAHGPHAASCQAIPVGVPTTLFAATTGLMATVLPAPTGLAREAPAGRRAPVAPLFLLHAPLLI